MSFGLTQNEKKKVDTFYRCCFKGISLFFMIFFLLMTYLVANHFYNFQIAILLQDQQQKFGYFVAILGYYFIFCVLFNFLSASLKNPGYVQDYHRNKQEEINIQMQNLSFEKKQFIEIPQKDDYSSLSNSTQNSLQYNRSKSESEYQIINLNYEDNDKINQKSYEDGSSQFQNLFSIFSKKNNQEQNKYSELQNYSESSSLIKQDNDYSISFENNKNINSQNKQQSLQQLSSYRNNNQDNINNINSNKNSQINQGLRKIQNLITQNGCNKCEKIRPLRAHHCTMCNQCILKMDHHCPWINNCVGHLNQQYFMNMLLYASFQLIFMNSLQLFYLNGEYYQEVSFSRLMMNGACYFLVFMIIPFTIWSWFLGLTGNTTLEFMTRYSANYNEKLKMKVLYDFRQKSIINNLECIYGTKNIFKILLPYHRSQKKFDGINWERPIDKSIIQENKNNQSNQYTVQQDCEQ
ncbi:hypothetical protein PPERSA_11297 [Pseudocohnilembus persalinus]|uniref:Palmitoyltransferase n=1 Tax=Pseudocohnilembus persalinus TaxID=266149 RepID=A0A0V0QPR5_PSEPJ|nr:hypothetical protein PPERSA_11297 [Pseudocohnilembus persalinus]|eukprot:KRX04173.1 hypothetical protein PPERSA_11297 [Pseudocohnilembus persalinus]